MPKLPGVNHLRAVKALQKAGFQIDRQSKHIFLSKGRAGTPLPAVGHWQRNQRHTTVVRLAEDCPPYHP